MIKSPGLTFAASHAYLRHMMIDIRPLASPMARHNFAAGEKV